MQIVSARSAEHWEHAAGLLLAYQQETAAELGLPRPGRPEDVASEVRDEVLDPSSAFDSYFIAYEGAEPVGGTAVVVHDEAALMVTRCYVVPHWRRQGVARRFTEAVLRHAERRDDLRLVVEVPPTRTGVIDAWRRMSFVDAEPWGDPTMVHLERPVG